MRHNQPRLLVGVEEEDVKKEGIGDRRETYDGQAMFGGFAIQIKPDKK